MHVRGGIDERQCIGRRQLLLNRAVQRAIALGHSALSERKLFLVGRMPRVATAEERIVLGIAQVHALEAQIFDARRIRAVAVEVSHRAGLDRLAAAPDAAHDRAAVGLTHDHLRVVGLPGHVHVRQVVVRGDLVAHGLGLGDELAQSWLAAKRRFDREPLRVGAIVTSQVPADKQDGGAFDARRLHAVEQVFRLGEAGLNLDRHVPIQRTRLDAMEKKPRAWRAWRMPAPDSP